MELSAFRAKLKEVWDKAWMDHTSRAVLVYDTDEWGDILINEMGTFCFPSTINQNWITCYLNTKNVANLRFAKNYIRKPDREDKEPYRSYVRINFTSGERIIFENYHESFFVSATVYLIDNQITKDEFIELQKQCSTKKLTFVLEEALK